ncbi:hypothetical protein [Micromonospora aurantiaca (nom. illeg.)]|uniref:hypothetical protein n=1 Tax=Micromonospora aurantiaca (nom. illeg.) TaxID=47850 RepID=UPI003EB91FD3
MTTNTNPQTIVDTFNTEHSSVTWVRYWTGTRDDAPKYDLTDGKAWLLGGHTPVVRVRGESSCIALTHVDVLPGQPDDIADDSRDLPDPVDAAQRVKEYISATGDGIYDVADGNPLYARDLEALRRATERASEVEMCAEKTQIDLEKARGEIAGLTAANQRLLNHLHAATPDLVTAQQRADQAEDRATDLANRLHHAEQEIASHNKAVTHWAEQVEELKKQLAVLEPTEPQYLIWSHKQLAWWGPGGHGYRLDICNAGRFPLDKAQDHATTRTWPAGKKTPPEVVIPAPPLHILADPERIGEWTNEQIEKATAEKIAARAATAEVA